MDGPTHRKIAPVFTAGTAYLTVTARGVDLPTVIMTVGVASAVSVLSANWADADLYASRPFPAIWSGTKIGSSLGVKKAKVKTANSVRPTIVYVYKKKRHTKVKKLSMRIWASLFRVLGVRGHRVWQSHSPVLWVPIMYIAYASMLSVTGDDNIIKAMIPAVVLGLGAGYVSHLFGDLMTYRGLPLLPEFKTLWKIPIIGGIIKWINKLFSNLQVAKFGFAKASSKGWNNFVYIMIILGVFYIIFPIPARNLVDILYGTIRQIALSLWDILSVLMSNYKS